MSDEKYQGHANRETWHVSLWLNNDESFYRAARHIALASPDADDDMRELVVEDVLGDEPPANLATDLLIHALARVDYREIVEGFRED